MSLKIAIVGLPNVGKSTLFNALTKTKAAEAANYPFCTIDPNVGVVEVPDERLYKLAKIMNSEKIIPSVIEFVDIAGLVKGASQGEGLGNKFLSHIRECSAIAHVVRGFSDDNIIHVHGEIHPANDREVIESELLIADVATVEKRLHKAKSDAKSGDKKRKDYADLLERIYTELMAGKLANQLGLSEEELELTKDLHLLTIKPNIYIVNLHEQDVAKADPVALANQLKIDDPKKIIPISARVEEELIGFSPEEAAEFLAELGLKKTGLDNLVTAAYETLGLITYFTVGPKEARAWTIEKGFLAPQAAGVIHTDFEKGFIKAEVYFWKDLVDAGSEAAVKEKGQLRLEGKDYLVKDGDVMHFKFAN